MKLILPPGMARAKFDRALADLRKIVGAQWLLVTDEDRETYLDPYATGDRRAAALARRSRRGEAPVRREPAGQHPPAPARGMSGPFARTIAD